MSDTEDRAVPEDHRHGHLVYLDAQPGPNVPLFLDELVDRPGHQSWVTRAAMRLGLEQPDAEEVSADTVAEAREGYRGDNGASFETYLRHVLHYRVLDRLKELPDAASFDAGWESGLLEGDEADDATLYATTPIVPPWTPPGPARETERYGRHPWHGQKAHWETDPVTAEPIWSRTHPICPTCRSSPSTARDAGGTVTGSRLAWSSGQ